MTREQVVSQINAWKGPQSHAAILSEYNAIRPLPRGYKVQPKDNWCAATVSAVFHKCGAPDFPYESSCGQMIAKAKALGIWQENDAYRPQPGDVIMYDWQDTGRGDDIGWPDHTGIVTAVNGSAFTVMEGNHNGGVNPRTMTVNGRYIRGYITPRFSQATANTTTGTKSVAQIAREVMAGKWGNGSERRQRLAAAGYDYRAIQAEVNKLWK